MPQFLYQLDDLDFRLPWTQPDSVRLRLWFKDFTRRSAARTGYQFHLIGLFWSSGASSAQSISLIASDDKNLDATAPDPCKAAVVRNLLREGVSLAIEKYRFYLDFSFAGRDSADQLYSMIQAAERDGKVSTNFEESVQPRWEPFLRYRRVDNGEEKYDRQIPFRTKIDFPEGALFDRSGDFEKQLIIQSARGRVFYPPILLSELFAGVSPL